MGIINEKVLRQKIGLHGGYYKLRELITFTDFKKRNEKVSKLLGIKVDGIVLARNAIYIASGKKAIKIFPGNLVVVD